MADTKRVDSPLITDAVEELAKRLPSAYTRHNLRVMCLKLWAAVPNPVRRFKAGLAWLNHKGKRVGKPWGYFKMVVSNWLGVFPEKAAQDDKDIRTRKADTSYYPSPNSPDMGAAEKLENEAGAVNAWQRAVIEAKKSPNARDFADFLHELKALGRNAAGCLVVDTGRLPLWNKLQGTLGRSLCEAAGLAPGSVAFILAR